MASGSQSVDVSGVAGPVLLGYLLNWGLYGALSVQLFYYYVSFPRDGRAAKALVLFVYALETTQTLIMTNDCFNAYVRNFGNFEILNAMQNEWLAVPVFTAILSCTVQLFYAYRLHIMASKQFVVPCIIVLALTQLIAGIITGVKSLQIGNFSSLEAHLRVTEPIWMASSVVCDLIIAGSMAYFMLHQDYKSRTSRVLPAKLVRLVIETGALTAVFATLDCILYFAVPAKPYHVCTASILAKLYSNALLVVLNGRVRGGAEGTSVGALRGAQRLRDTFGVVSEGQDAAVDVLPLEVRGDDTDSRVGKDMHKVGLV